MPYLDASTRNREFSLMTKTTDMETGFAPLFEVVKHLRYPPNEPVGAASDQNLCWLLSFIQRDDLAVMNERQERNAVAEFVLFWASQGASGRRPAPVRRRNLVEFAASMREGLKTLQSGQS